MPSESIPAPQPKSLESLKIKFKERLDAILYKQLTIENIETFACEALSETVALTDDVLKEYKNNPNFHTKLTTLNTQQQENEAFTTLDLPNIQNILQSIIDIKDKIVALKKYLEISTEVSNVVITPPQENNTTILPGKNNFKEKKIFPRLLTLMYILEQDFEIQKEAVKIIEGKITPEMMRQTPYVRVEIPDLDRVVYICNEEKNVSYVFDTTKLSEKNLTLDKIDIENKGDKNSLIAKYLGIGIRIIQSKHWRENITTALEEPIFEIQKKLEEEDQLEKTLIHKVDMRVVAKGELDPWRGFWTDIDTGKHWGGKSSIAKKLGKSDALFRSRIIYNRLQTLVLIDLMNRSQDGYCFEKFVEFFSKSKTEKRVEIKGDWRGFWTDPETGKHWASIEMLQNKLDASNVTIKKYAKKSDLKHINIEGISGQNIESYCYEDFLKIDKFVDLITAPKVDEEGEWSGFWTDDTNKHWAPLSVLESYFDIARTTMKLFTKKMNLADKKIKTRSKEVHTAFCLESFKKNKEFMEFVNLPRSDKEGVWIGFWADNNGKHWGPVSTISRKLFISENKIKQLIRKSSIEFPSMPMKDASGRGHNGFCLEEIEKN